MTARRILVLTSSHLCRNPRVVKEATTLGLAGYDVTVLTVSSHTRFDRMDEELLRGLPFRRVALDYASDRPHRKPAKLWQRAGTWASRWLCRTLRLQFAQSLGPAGPLLRLARRHPADLTIVHTEIPIWAAQHLIRDGRKVAVDVEDWYSEDLLFADRQSRPLKLLRKAEAFVLNRCTYASATSQAMADALHAAYSCPTPIVIRNSFPLHPRSRLDTPRREAKPRFIWFSQTIGPGRGLELFFAAWTRTKTPSEVYLLGDERAGYRERLLGRLSPERHRDVHFLPLVTLAELPDRLAQFDLGLALEPHLPLNRDITITNKILQYMNAGLAVTATDTAGQKEVMSRAADAGLLVAAHETTDFAEQLDRLISDPERIRACQQAARRWAHDEFSWEREAPRLLATVEGALASPAA